MLLKNQLFRIVLAFRLVKGKFRVPFTRETKNAEPLKLAVVQSRPIPNRVAKRLGLKE